MIADEGFQRDGRPRRADLPPDVVQLKREREKEASRRYRERVRRERDTVAEAIVNTQDAATRLASENTLLRAQLESFSYIYTMLTDMASDLTQVRLALAPARAGAAWEHSAPSPAGSPLSGLFASGGSRSPSHDSSHTTLHVFLILLVLVLPAFLFPPRSVFPGRADSPVPAPALPEAVLRDLRLHALGRRAHLAASEQPIAETPLPPWSLEALPSDQTRRAVCRAVSLCRAAFIADDLAGLCPPE